LNNLAAAWAADTTVEEALRVLDEAHIPCGTVQTITEVVEDPQVKAREMVVDVDHPGSGSVPLPGIVIKMSKTQGKIDTPAPQVGQHNEEVYGQLLELSAEEIDELKEKNVI